MCTLTRFEPEVPRNTWLCVAGPDVPSLRTAICRRIELRGLCNTHDCEPFAGVLLDLTALTGCAARQREREIDALVSELCNGTVTAGSDRAGFPVVPVVVYCHDQLNLPHVENVVYIGYDVII
jgi:hypothetical protein